MQKYRTRAIAIGGIGYRAVIADTSVKRAIGLMFRERLEKGTCMLFVFGSPGYHGIWMHNMRFPLDVLWLDRNGIVVDKRENLEPCESMLECPQHQPKGPASYIIELNAGEIGKKKIRAGARARI